MAKDIIYNGDIDISSGDLLVAESNQQHVEHILLSDPGHFKHVPWMGVGLKDYLNSPFSPKIIAELEKNIKLQLESDGATKVNVTINSATDANIEASYE